MAFIIGTYNRFDQWDRSHAKYKFEINGNWYAVFEVEMEWGIPVLPTRVDRNETGHEYYVYDTYEDAMKFVWQVKSMNAR